jgi:hypothetical protein
MFIGFWLAVIGYWLFWKVESLESGLRFAQKFRVYSLEFRVSGKFRVAS